MQISQLTQINAERIATWHYPDQYAFYNTDADQEDYQEIKSAQQRGNRFYQVLNSADDLLGYFAIEPTSTPGILEVGLGMAPAFTGQGQGLNFVNTLVAFIVAQYQPTKLIMDVAKFNQRAQTVYQRADFIAIRTYDQFDEQGQVYPFIMMEKVIKK